MLFAALSFAVAFAILCIDVTVDLTAERRIKSVYYTLILTPFIATVFGSIALVSFTMLFYYSLHAPPETIQLAQALTKFQGAMMILYFSIIVPEYVRVLHGSSSANYTRIGATHVAMLILCISAIVRILASGPLALVVY